MLAERFIASIIWRMAMSSLLVTVAAVGITLAGSRGERALGHDVLFISDRDGNDDIYVLDVRTHINHNLVRNDGWQHGPTRSADNQWIAFASRRDGNPEI